MTQNFNEIGSIIGRTGRDMRHQQGSTPEDILHRAKENGFRMDPGTLKQVADVIPGVVHNWDSNVTVICYGSVNSGKTRLLSRLYNDELAEKLEIEIPGATEPIRLLEPEDCPDKSEYLIRVGFKNGVTFWDSPGFQSDDPKLANMSRAFAGLEQQGPPAWHVSEIRVIDTALHPLAIQNIPIQEFESQRLEMENPIAIYCMDPTLTPFSPELQSATRADILALHEIYGDRLIIVCTFKDKLDNWNQKKRDQREELLNYALARDVLGRDAIVCSSTTGEALQTVVKRIFAVSGQNTAKFSEYIQDELRGSRFQHALSNLSKLLAGGLITNYYEAMPYSDLFDRLMIISGVYLQETYSVDEETWQNCNGKIEDIMMSHDLEQFETNKIQREAQGWWERFLSVFGKRYYSMAYTASLALIQEICVALYELIHTLEKGIQTERVDAERVAKWFADAFAERGLEDAIRRKDVVAAQLTLEDTWIAFFKKFHNSSLDVLTQMSTQMSQEKEENHAA